MKRQTATVDCPKSMVGRVIGKNGETIKALQTYTGALIQIDQTVEPTKVTISGTPHSLSLAVSMVTDIVKGTFKGFALLRQITTSSPGRVPGLPPTPAPQPRPVYAPGYGLIPPSQLYGADDRTAVPGAVVQMDYSGRRTQQAMTWAPGQVAPSQLIMGLQPGGVYQQQMQPGEDAMAGMMTTMQGYAPATAMPMAYTFAPPEYMMPGMMQAPPEMMYDPSALMAHGSTARLYGAAAGGAAKALGGPPNGGAGGASGSGRPSKGPSSPDGADMMAVGPGWMQVMDPEGKLYCMSTGQQ